MTRAARKDWNVREMTFEEAEEDSVVAHLRMTPAERVRLVPKLFDACLSTRGIRECPRLRRVCSYPQ